MINKRLGLVLASWALLLAQLDDGVLIVRDAALASAVRQSDKACADYAQAQERADSAPYGAKASARRERASLIDAARRLLAQCVAAEESARVVMTKSIGPRAAERVQKASAFEDMVYVKVTDSEGLALDDRSPAKGR